MRDDEASGVAGSLSGLFSVGADEPLTISLSATTSGLPTLFSQGEEVTYSVTDGASSDTLTATAGGRTVFTLVVNADGSWTFDLDDQLDHVDDGPNTENFALRTTCWHHLGTEDRLLVDRCGDRRGRRRDPAATRAASRLRFRTTSRFRLRRRRLRRRWRRTVWTPRWRRRWINGNDCRPATRKAGRQCR